MLSYATQYPEPVLPFQLEGEALNTNKERIVLCFDIASSTVILEDLQLTGTARKYQELIQPIFSFLERESTHFCFEIYKFLGDGYLLIFLPGQSIDTVLLFTIALVIKSLAHIKAFIEATIETKEIDRTGITIGIDEGELFALKSGSHREFYGRPLNMACRLQSSMNGKEHVNRVLLSKRCYSNITEEDYRILCSHTTRRLKNIKGQTEISCYEFSPLFYKEKDETTLRAKSKKKLAETVEQSPDFTIRINQRYDRATSSTSIISLDERNTKR